MNLRKKNQRNPRDRALRLLTVRDRFVREMQDRLQRDGFSEGEVRDTIQWLKDIGYLDDRKTAALWVQNRNRFRITGNLGLRYELTAKGVEESVTEEVLNARDKEAELAAQAAERRLPLLGNEDSLRRRQKLLRFLQRRGFTWDVAAKAVKETLGDSLDSDP